LLPERPQLSRAALPARRRGAIHETFRCDGPSKRINRFEVAYTEDGQRHATEVVMDVQT
jgi:hypothetical protein